MSEHARARSGPSRRVAVGVVLVGFILALFFWYLVGTGGTGDNESSQTVDFLEIIRRASTVVELIDVADTGETVIVDNGKNAVRRATVAAVLYQWPEDEMLQPGDQIVLRDPLRTETGELGEAGAGPVVVFLGFPSPERLHEFEIPWAVRFAGVRTAHGFDFIGTLPSEPWGGYQEELISLRAYLEGETTRDTDAELGVLVDWVREVNQVPPGTEIEDITGEITRAYLSAERRFAGLRAAWYAQSPLVRPLDLELTPGTVLSDLTEWNLLVEVVPEAQVKDVYLIVRIPLGVAAVSELAGGSHPAVILVDPEATWEIVLTTDLDSGVGPVVAEVNPSLRVGAFAIGVEIRPELVAAVLADPDVSSVTPGYTVVRRLDRPELEQRVADLARAAAES